MVLSHTHAHDPAFRRELDRVGQQVRDGLAQAMFVSHGEKKRTRLFELQRQTAFGRRAALVFYGSVNDCCKVQRPLLNRKFASDDPRDL